MTHEARRLNSAACHTCQLAEGHAKRRHACVLTVGNDNAIGEGLDTADTLEAAAGGHRVFHNGVQGYFLKSSLGCLSYHTVYVRVNSLYFVLAAFLGNRLAGSCGVQLLGCLSVQPGNGSAKSQTLRSYHAAV